MRRDGRTGWRTRRRVLRACALLAAAHLALAHVARGQAPAAPSHAPSAGVRYGKWAALGVAAGFTVLGVAAHDRAEARYGDLLAYCREQRSCSIGLDGRYGSAAAEALYQRVLRSDRTARRWLIGGQAALVGSAVLFVIELKRKRGPDNIPYSPYIAAGRFGTDVGVRIAWRKETAREARRGE